jgi:hypothetical protein
LVKLKPIHHLNNPPASPETKMFNFDGLFQSNKMEKKDIIIYVAMLLLAGLGLYRRYMKKKSDAGSFSANKPREKNSLSAQPDDYEPYSGKKQPE